MIRIARFTWDWRFWGPFHPRVQKLKRGAHFATVQHLSVRPRERQHQDAQNQRTVQLQSRHYESKCAEVKKYNAQKGFPVIDLITGANEESRNDLRCLKWAESDVLDSAAASLKWEWGGESCGALHLHLINRPKLHAHKSRSHFAGLRDSHLSLALF